MRYNSACLRVFAFVIISGCQQPHSDTSQAERFGEAFVRAIEIIPYQSTDTPLIRVTSLDFDSAGRFLIADASEGNVKLYGTTGKLLRVFGRKGSGPGEFVNPRYARFIGEDSVVVVDPSLLRATFYSIADTLTSSSSPLPALGIFIFGFAVRSDGNFVFTVAGRRDSTTLVVTDRQGGVVGAYLPIAFSRPKETPESALWNSVRVISLSMRSDTAYVVSSLVDSLWVVDTNTGAVSAGRIGVTGRTAPSLPARPVQSSPDLLAWAKTFHSTGPVVITGERSLFVPFVKGSFMDRDSVLLAVRHSDGTWRSFHSSPAVLASRGNEIVALSDSLSLEVSLNTYTSRTRQ